MTPLVSCTHLFTQEATLPDQLLLENKVQMGMQYITVQVMPFHLYSAPGNQTTPLLKIGEFVYLKPYAKNNRDISLITAP